MCQIHSVAYVVLQAIFNMQLISAANIGYLWDGKIQIGKVGNPAKLLKSYFFGNILNLPNIIIRV